MVNIYLLTGVVIGNAIEIIAFAGADVFIEDGFVGCRPVVQMQIHGLVTSILGLKVVLIYSRFTHHVTIEIESVVLADGFIDVLGLIGMHHNRDADIQRAVPIIEMAGISSASHGRSGHRILRRWVIERIGRGPAIGIVADAAHSHGVKRRRCAFTKFGIVGINRRRHRFHRHRALGRSDQHQFAERDVVEAEVVAATHSVLVQNGDGGRGGVATIPKLVELQPLTSIGRSGKDITYLLSVDAKLEAGLVTSRTDRAHPSREGIVGIGDHGDLLRPDIGIRRRCAIDNHKITRTTMTRAQEIGMEICSIRAYIIGAFRIQV